MTNEDDPADSTEGVDEDSKVIAAEPTPAKAGTTTARGWGALTLEADLGERRDRIQDSIDNCNHFIDFLEENQNTVLVFFVISREILCEKIVQLLAQELVAEDIRREEDMNETHLFRQLSDEERSNSLKHYDIVDPDLVDDIEDTINYRNNMTHDPTEQQRIRDLDELSTRVETAYEAVQSVEESIDGSS